MLRVSDDKVDIAVQLLDNEVHIWRTDVQQVSVELIERYRQLMSGAELERNQRYRFEKSRHCDCVTRALARTVLSHYADIAPADWTFIKGEHGKPEISPGLAPALRFNLSHTDRFVVCAVTRTLDIGIDIENTQRKNQVLDIADHFFSKQEVSDLFALPKERQSDRFFDYWTLKEAYMKASGEGISLGLGNFSFHLNDDVNNSQKIGISFGEKIADNAEDWRFWLFRPAQDHRMGLALKTSQLKGGELKDRELDNRELNNKDLNSREEPVVRFFQTVPLQNTVSEG